MKPGHALLAALCVLSPALRADDTALSGEPLLIPGTFTATDAAAQPLALWLERGHGSLAAPASAANPAEENPALSLPAQQPAARACLLLDAPEVQPASIRLRLKLEPVPAGESDEPTASLAPEALEWELAGVPFRLVGHDENDRWRAEYHTAESGWRPLLAAEGEDLAAGSGWHTLTLDFTAATSSAPRQWRLHWDEREPSPWITQTHAEPPLLVVGAGTRTALWLDDVATTLPPAPATGEPPPGSDPEAAAAALAARNAALRQEIASALAELTRETGVRRVRLRRPAGAFLPAATVQRSPSATRRLEVLTPLEDKQTHDETSASSTP